MEEIGQQGPAVRRGVRKKDIISLIAFTLLFSLILWELDILFYNDSKVCTVWETIESGEGPEILIMGNSHAYCTYVPDIITGSTGLSCGILGSSAENMFLTVENFKTVLNYYTPELVVLEANTVTANSRETLRTEKQEVLYRDIDGMKSPFERIRASCAVLRVDDIPLGVSQLFRQEYIWTRWKKMAARVKGVSVVNRYKREDVSGYKFRNTYTGGTAAPEQIGDRVSELYAENTGKQLADAVNEAAFIEFLELAQERKIPVMIFKSPTMRAAVNIVSGLKRIEEIAADYPCCLIVKDFHLSIREIGLNLEDFYDSGHLNRRGAVKVTTWFLEQRFLPNQPEPEYDSVFAYRTESVETVRDGVYRYQMENFDQGAQYQFRLGSEVVKDWSTENFCEVELVPTEADRLRCEMLPAQCPKDQQAVMQLQLPFMKQNDSVIDSANG